MHYVNLGRTGLKISAIVLGCGNFGGMGSRPELFGKVTTRPEAFAIMDRAWELGINCFDTADSYGGGLSESFIGEWLKQKGAAVRDQLVLSSKVRSRVGDGPNDQGLSRHRILRQIELSLRRLGADYLDLYITHSPDPATPLEETLGALDGLVRQGKVRYIGAANMPAWLLAKALWISDRHGFSRFEWVQNSYSLLDRTDERQLIPLLQDQQLGYTPFSPLAGGWLTSRYRAGEPIPPGSRAWISARITAPSPPKRPSPPWRRCAAMPSSVAWTWPRWRWPGSCRTRWSLPRWSAPAVRSISTSLSPPWRSTWLRTNGTCWPASSRIMSLFPEFQIGLLNGWIPLVLYFLGLMLSVSLYSKESRLWLFNNPRDERKRLFLFIRLGGQLAMLAYIGMLIVTPLHIDHPIFLVGAGIYAIGYLLEMSALHYFRMAAPGEPVVG